jgi:hemolysin activation/secretion protein
LQHHLLRTVACSLALLVSPGLLHAQTPPDAGTLLREQPKPPSVPVPRPATVKPEPPAAKPDESGPRILVKSVRVQGATQIPAQELEAQLAGLVGKEWSLGELQAAALQLIGYYAQRGYLARVLLPQQDIKDGVVTYQVIEGTRGSLKVTPKGERIDAARVGSFVDARLPAGGSMDMAALGEALNILNEQPGVSVTASLAPGQGESAVDINVAANERPLIGYRLLANNYGTRGTGVYQMTGDLTLSNPTGRFDSASLLFNAAEGSLFGRGDYSIAVGDRGLRLGVNASYLDYRLVQDSFSALASKGTAETFGLTATYPLARRSDFNLSMTGSLDHKHLEDQTVVGETGNRVVKVANIGISGYTLLTVGVPGALIFGAGVSSGDTDQRNAAALTVDQAVRRTQGDFTKLSYNAAINTALSEAWSFFSALRGQVAGKNLDSSERFSLGGMSGVRAYPTSEAIGDEGWLLNLNAMRRLNEQLNLGLFVDTGQITVNHTVPAIGGLTTPNRYSLTGAGTSLDWQLRERVSLNLTLAAPIGNNPGKDAAGNNSDGRSNKLRFWAGFSAQL